MLVTQFVRVCVRESVCVRVLVSVFAQVHHHVRTLKHKNIKLKAKVLQPVKCTNVVFFFIGTADLVSILLVLTTCT